MQLPTRFYQRDSCYRTFEHQGCAGFICCGFAQKDGVREDAVDAFYPFYAAVYVLRGSGTLIDHCGVEHAVQAGDLIQRNPRLRHSLLLDPGSDWAEAFVGISNDPIAEDGRRNRVLNTGYWEAPSHNVGLSFVDMVSRLAIIDPTIPVMHPGIQVDLLQELQGMVKDMRAAEGVDLPKLQLRLLKWLGALASRCDQDREEGLVEEACEAIAADLNNRRSIPEILTDLPVSYSRLRAMFREKMGMAPGTYRIHRRIEAACVMLGQGTKNPTEVADELGYKNYAAFSSQFKLVLGISPREFRRSLGRR